MLTTLAELGILVRVDGNAEQRVRCPHCAKNDRDRTLGVNIDTGKFHCFRCEFKGVAGVLPTQAPIIRVARFDDLSIAARKRERLRQTWRETLPLSHVRAFAVRRYLESRALGDVLKSPPTVLRAHACLPYWDGTQHLGMYPAMVALFHSAAGQPVTLHVTYLRSDGCAKASVPSPKKILGAPVRGSTKGGAIRLYEPQNGVLGVAEGVESALSLHVLHNIPTWAAFCADNLTRIQLPNVLRRLFIGVDIDASGKGEQVGQALADRVLRWKCRPEVFFVKPEGDAPCDLNDELRQRRAS